MESTYITTSIPYVNASPHVGHALELVQADAAARYARLCGSPTLLQTGTDENAHKNVSAAREMGVAVEELVDRNAGAFRRLVESLEVRADSFIRTTEARHRRGVHAFWSSLAPGDLYTARYSGLYCEGCEEFLLPRELVDGNCPDHGRPPTPVSEQNVFFRLSAYQEPIEQLIRGDQMSIVPDSRRREVLSFVESGLTDISVTRETEKMEGWGIPVPGSPDQTIYVWIDALVNYLTGIGLGSGGDWRRTWTESRRVHVIGKNVWKFHAVYWPALLLSAGLPVPTRIVVHGFLTVDGRKISKSLGNAVDPLAVVSRLGSDPLRYYLLALDPFRDGDYRESRLVQLYNRDLADRLGGTVTRVTALCRRASVVELPADTAEGGHGAPEAPADYHRSMETYRFDRAIEAVRGELAAINSTLDTERPWEARDGRPEVVRETLRKVYAVVRWLEPILPSAGRRLRSVLEARPIEKPPVPFPRIETARD